jgi:hypothetical protein
MALSSSVALVFAGAALFCYETYLERQGAARELVEQASIIAETSTAAVRLDDERAAMQALEALRGEGSLKDVIIFNGNRPFARHRHVGRDAGAPPTQPRAPGVYFEGGSVLVLQPVWLEG